MMQRFHQLAQNYPETRGATERIRDSDEIYREFASLKAAEQSSRCLQCGVPFCQVHCPLHNNIPDWLKLVAEGRLKEAYEVSSATNNFPEICGRICPQDKLCEGNCVVNKDFGAITIGAVEKYITEVAWKEGWVTGFAPLHEQSFSVAIIGAGPAGLAAAETLRRKGIQVHIYDRHDRAGGLLIYGIPNFKLDKKIVSRRIAQYTQSGIQFHLGVEIGRDVTLQELQSQHD
ncbi:MAG: NAD(P)-binding protein, partial [Alphaproteobacteria bacterium]